jgi:hypothetical protein
MIQDWTAKYHRYGYRTNSVPDPCHLVWIRIRGSMPLMDPDSDPDASIFITDLQDAKKNLI